MNVKTLIAASLLTLSAATAAHASDRDAYPQPNWDPTASDVQYHSQYPSDPRRASLDERMRATGSGTSFCQQELYPLEPNSGRNVLAGTC